MDWTATHIRVGLDLSNGGLVKLSSVTLPFLDVVGLLDTGGVTLGKAALVDVGGPVQVGLGGSSVDTRLESDDELSGDDVALLGERSRGRKNSGEQSSEEDSEVANVDHLDNYDA